VTSNPQGAADWIRLSTAVARMSEIDPAYRTYRGLARRDLEIAIRAGRVRIRGCPVGPPEPPPEEIEGPITPDYELDLIRDSLKERRAGPLQATLGSMTLFRSVEVEWTGAARYLRSPSAGGGNQKIIDSPPALAADHINPEATERKRAPLKLIDTAISAVYDEAEKAGTKPPNLKEIGAAVNKKLCTDGYEASDRRIQEIASVEKHAKRRRKPGKTVLSEKSRD
jgi:hypothetical protein